MGVWNDCTLGKCASLNMFVSQFIWGYSILHKPVEESIWKDNSLDHLFKNIWKW